MQIRRLIHEDIDQLFAFRLEALRESPKMFLSTYEEEATAGPTRLLETLQTAGVHNVIFGAFEAQKLVGMAGIYLGNRPKTQHMAEIWGMYVDPEHRGQQIGARLMDALIEHARHEMKAAIIFLGVESNNHSAVRLYESNGFKSWGMKPLATQFRDRFYTENNMYLKLGVSQKKSDSLEPDFF